MLTQQLLLAIAQGLPSHLLANLGPPYLHFCRRLDLNLHKGLAPVDALKAALFELDPYDVRLVLRALRETRTVESLPGLTPRHKQLLLALRLSGPATCGVLSKTFGVDSHNTRKRLQALVASGWIGRYSQWGAILYFALPPGRDNSHLPSDQQDDLLAFLSGDQPQHPDAGQSPAKDPSVSAIPDASPVRHPHLTTPPTPVTPFTPLTPLTPPPSRNPTTTSYPSRSPRGDRTMYSAADILASGPPIPSPSANQHPRVCEANSKPKAQPSVLQSQCAALARPTDQPTNRPTDQVTK